MNNEHTPPPEPNPDLPAGMPIDMALRLVENCALDIIAGIELDRRRAEAAGEIPVERVRGTIAICTQWLEKMARIEQQIPVAEMSSLWLQIAQSLHACRVNYTAVLPDETHGDN
jgi:hypothetical protein